LYDRWGRAGRAWSVWHAGRPCSLGRVVAESGRGRGLGGARVSRVYRLWEARFLLAAWLALCAACSTKRPSLHGSAWPWSGWVTGVALVFDIRSLLGHVCLSTYGLLGHDSL